MKTIPRVEAGKPGTLLDAHRANELIDAFNRLLKAKLLVDPLLTPNASRIEDNGTTITFVIGTRK